MIRGECETELTVNKAKLTLFKIINQKESEINRNKTKKSGTINKL